MVIRLVQVPVGDRLPGMGRMDEAATPCINTHVIDVTAVDPEKDQVARRECVRRNRTRRTPLRIGGAGNRHTRFVVGVYREPAAVEPV